MKELDRREFRYPTQPLASNEEDIELALANTIAVPRGVTS